MSFTLIIKKNESNKDRTNNNDTTKRKKGQKKDNTKRQKNMEEKFNNSISLFKDDQDVISNNEVSINVKSSRVEDTEYEVKIINDGKIRFECNCGDQYDISPRRKNCKHIACVLVNFMKFFIEGSEEKDATIDDINVDTLSQLFNNMMGIFSKEK